MSQVTRKRIELRAPLATAPPSPLPGKSLTDYPRLSRPHADVVRLYASPLLMGPPVCDELVALIEHLFTEDEAAVVRRLGIARARDARQVARAERRPEDQVAALLEGLAERRIIVSGGPPHRRRYRLLPLMPGVFEMVLIDQSADTCSPWHRRFAELMEALFVTGYAADYWRPSTPSAVRYLPVGQAIEAHPMALPSDRLEVVLERFDTFGIGICQCRTSAEAAGHGCDAPRGNCTVMGEWAERGIESGWLKKVSRQNVLEIKREAESHGLVTWMMNIASTKGQCSCSCCGCCCKALRTVSEFNAPNLFAPPHFLPAFDLSRCTYCGLCAKQCPMGAIAVDALGKMQLHRPERCIGCGLCAVACRRQQAVRMEAVPDYRLPYKSWFSYLLRGAPAMLRTSWRVWRERST